MDAGQPLDRLVQHQKGNYETGELAGRHGVNPDLLARIGEQRDDRDGGEEFDERGCDGLMRYVPQIAELKPACRGTETVRFDFFIAERLHHLMAADGLLQNLIQLRGVVLCAARRLADAPAEANGRHQDEWQYSETEERQPPVVLHNDPQQADHGERLTQPVSQNVRGRDLDLFDVVHDGGHQPARGGGLVELRVLPEDAVEDRLAEVGDGGEADVIDQVIAEVIADALDRERS